MYPIRTQKKRDMVLSFHSALVLLVFDRLTDPFASVQLEGCKKGGLIDTFDTWCVQMNEAFGGKKLMGGADASAATSPIKR